MATISITTTAAQDARISTAFGSYLRLGRNATGAEVKGALITLVKQVVQDYENNEATATAVAGVTTITPT